MLKVLRLYTNEFSERTLNTAGIQAKSWSETGEWLKPTFVHSSIEGDRQEKEYEGHSLQVAIRRQPGISSGH